MIKFAKNDESLVKCTNKLIFHRACVLSDMSTLRFISPPSVMWPTPYMKLSCLLWWTWCICLWSLWWTWCMIACEVYDASLRNILFYMCDLYKDLSSHLSFYMLIFFSLKKKKTVWPDFKCQTKYETCRSRYSQTGSGRRARSGCDCEQDGPFKRQTQIIILWEDYGSGPTRNSDNYTSGQSCNNKFNLRLAVQ